MKIQYEVGDNLGGLAMLFYVPVEDILSIPPAIDGVISQDILLHPGKTWSEAYFTMESLGYDERMRITAHGEEYTMELKGFLSKHTPDLAQVLTSLRRRRLVLVASDNNGQLLLIGDQEHYLTFERTFDTSTQTTGRNGIAVSFSGKNSHEAYFYQGSIWVGPGEPLVYGRGYLLLENGGRIII